MKTPKIGRLLDRAYGLFYKLTGGRPMILLCRGVLVDRVTGNVIHKYMDMFGRVWLATSPWARFRVAVPPDFCPTIKNRKAKE